MRFWLRPVNSYHRVLSTASCNLVSQLNARVKQEPAGPAGPLSSLSALVFAALTRREELTTLFELAFSDGNPFAAAMNCTVNHSLFLRSNGSLACWCDYGSLKTLQEFDPCLDYAEDVYLGKVYGY